MPGETRLLPAERERSLRAEPVASTQAGARAGARARPWWRPRLIAWAPLLVLVLLGVGIAAVNPRFLRPGNFVRIAEAASIPLVLATGATFVILMGSVDLSVEGIVALGAVLTSLLVRNGANGLDLGLVGVGAVLLTGGLVGWINGVIHVRLRIPSFMVTLGTWFVAAGLANAALGGIAVRINDPLVRALALQRIGGLPWGVWVALATLAAAWILQDHTRFGRYLYALGGGEELAALSGIPAARVRILAFTLAGICSALGGVMSGAQLGLGNAQIGQGRLFTAITAVVVGGTALSGGEGGVFRTLIGVLIVTVLANGMVLMGISPSVQTAVQGVMIIVAVSLSVDRARLRIVK